MGLAIGRQFAELMGGTIKVTSILGEGSTFAFDISSRVSRVFAGRSFIATPNHQTSRTRTTKISSRGSRRSRNRLALFKLLQSVGFAPRTANNGEKAIALWQQWQPDLIWMDMRMPVMDGYEATRTIKVIPRVRRQ